MRVKVIEIRDRATYIPAVAMQMVPWAMAEHAEQIRSLYAHVGFPGNPEQIILMRLNDQRGHCDPYDWGDSRTMKTVHEWLQQHFAEVEPGQVVDVEFILGEKPEPSIPQRLEAHFCSRPDRSPWVR